MTKIKFLAPVKWAHRNVEVRDYAKGEVIETDDTELIEVGLKEKWITTTIKGKEAVPPAEPPPADPQPTDPQPTDVLPTEDAPE